jgi:hydroxymethylpyrimidine pyrophosphatase-like HAD family hydrolase
MLLVVRVEAVVTDLDGTVVRSDFSVSPATLEALDLVRASGIAFVIATARTPQGLEHFQELARRTAMAVCCSGAIGWRSPDQSVTWMDVMPPDAIRHSVPSKLATPAPSWIAISTTRRMASGGITSIHVTD